jgi:succinate dehydrogenase / fumarate reductase cytochrome b subunit
MATTRSDASSRADDAPSTDASKPQPEGMLVEFGHLLLYMLKTVFRTVFAADASTMLHRSGLFMLIFLVVHMLGNITVFFGPAAFNGYGHKLTSNPLIRGIELYLLAASLAHGATASVLTVRKRSYIAKRPLERALLAVSGTVLAVFLVLHLQAFRFGKSGPAYEFVDAAGQRVRDLYKLQFEIFADPATVAFYLFSLGAVAVHLWHGWSKAVLRMDVEKRRRVPFRVLGHALIWPLVGGFALSPVYCFVVQRPDVLEAAGLGAWAHA